MGPRKPEGADRKAAWIVGSGLAGLAATAFLIRDGGVADRREMEEYFECVWDLYRSIPSLEIEDASVLDELCRVNKDVHRDGAIIHALCTARAATTPNSK